MVHFRDLLGGSLWPLIKVMPGFLTSWMKIYVNNQQTEWVKSLAVTDLDILLAKLRMLPTQDLGVKITAILVYYSLCWALSACYLQVAVPRAVISVFNQLLLDSIPNIKYYNLFGTLYRHPTI